MTEAKYLPKFDVYHAKMRLIAAAPELLAMAKAVTAAHYAAIAKAKGEPCPTE